MNTQPNESITENLKKQGFEVLSELGQGSSSIVYKIKNISDGQTYAAKIQKIDSNFSKEQDLMRLFRREAVALARIKNQGTVKVYTTLQLGTQMCTVMD